MLSEGELGASGEGHRSLTPTSRAVICIHVAPESRHGKVRQDQGSGAVLFILLLGLELSEWQTTGGEDLKSSCVLRPEPPALLPVPP